MLKIEKTTACRNCFELQASNPRNEIFTSSESVNTYFSMIPVVGYVEECPSGLVLCTCILDRKTTSGMVQLPLEVDWQFGRNPPHQNRPGRWYQPFFRLVMYLSLSARYEIRKVLLALLLRLFSLYYAVYYCVFHFLESHYSTSQGHQKMYVKIFILRDDSTSTLFNLSFI